MISRNEAARRLGFHSATMDKLPIPYLVITPEGKTRRAIRYRISDIDRFIAENTVCS